MRYEEGKEYIVTTTNAQLHIEITRPDGSMTFKNVPVPEGTILRCVGRRDTWGSDGINYPAFTNGTNTGMFQPNSWGTPMLTALSPVVGA